VKGVQTDVPLGPEPGKAGPRYAQVRRPAEEDHLFRARGAFPEAAPPQGDDTEPPAANRPAFFHAAGPPAQEVVMTKTETITCPCETANPPSATRKPAGESTRRKAVLASREPLLRHAALTGEREGETLIRLCPPPAMALHFPQRLRALVDEFHDWIGPHARAMPSPDGAGRVALLHDAACLCQLARVERTLARGFFRALGHRDAARFLGLEAEAFGALVAENRIAAFDRVPSFRFGRRFSYAVYAPEDLIALRDASERKPVAEPASAR
jgi:hypothetical protein